MRVNWYFGEDIGGGGYAQAYIEDTHLEATIYDTQYENIHEAWIDATKIKTDNSLLELMNWVEEELKFRWSHEVHS